MSLLCFDCRFQYESGFRLDFAFDAGTGVTANALHPGLVATNFSSGGGAYGWFVRRYARLFGKSAEDGARTTLYLATSPDVASVTGKYFIDEKPVESSAASRDPEAARRLWDLSERLVGDGELHATF